MSLNQRQKTAAHLHGPRVLKRKQSPIKTATSDPSVRVCPRFEPIEIKSDLPGQSEREGGFFSVLGETKSEASGYKLEILLLVGFMILWIVEGVRHSSMSPGDILLTIIPAGLLGLLIYYLMKKAFPDIFKNHYPKVTIRTCPSIHFLGDEMDLEWEARGPLDKVKKFTIKLIGEESATYRRGTSDFTSVHTFYENIIGAGETRESMLAGKAQLVFPKQTSHSFQACNNAILWKIRVHLSMQGLPDTNKDFNLTVNPLPEGEY